MVFSNLVIFASNNRLYALNYENGKILWSIGFAANIEFPVSINSDKFFVISGDKIYGFNFKTHTKIWEYQFPEKITQSLSASGDNVYISCRKELYALDPKTGRLNWKQFFTGEAMNSPTYFGNDVFASFDQYLYCLDNKSGKIKWQFEAGYYIESVPSVSEKYIWIGADDFNIYCVDRLSGKKLFESISGSTSYYVVIGNNQIFSLSVYGELFAFVPRAFEEEANIKFELWIGKKYARKNGKFLSIDAPPFIENGRTLVPIRVIGEALGATVNWFENDKKVTYALGTKFIELWIGNPIAYVSGKKVKLDTPPKIVNSRAFIPLRFVSENLSARVNWEPNEKRITIEYP
jgi:outer membrane protein assembly factor BamB